MQQKQAQISFADDGTPIAQHFDDVYFSKDDGVAETRYVFIENNRIPARWDEFEGTDFTICETGFGTGLNFLVVSETFIQWREQNPNAGLTTLHFISTEKYPLSQADKLQALAPFAEFELHQQLVQTPVLLTTGCHRFEFSLANQHSRIILDLWIGDVLTTLPQIHASRDGVIDAWFLDGFAPSKNPDMWQPVLFEEMRRLSKQTATFATFTAAGIVKRGLRDAGFVVEKRNGFGRKRDMLGGYLDVKKTERRDRPVITHQHPYFDRTVLANASKHEPVTIVGGGLAAANLCYALAKRGIPSQLLVKHEQLAMGASGNPQGGFYPLLNAEASIVSQIHLSSFLFAKRLYQQLLSSGEEFAHDWCGVVLLGFSPEVQKRQRRLLNGNVWPNEIVQPISSADASTIANVPLQHDGLFIPHGGWLSPPELVSALVNAASKLVNVEIQLGTEVTAINSLPTGKIKLNVLRHQAEEQQLTCQQLVIAAGHASATMPLCEQIPMTLTRGQVEQVKSKGQIANLATVLCHKGYLTPAQAHYHSLGSTYIKNDVSTEYRCQERELNQQTHQKCLSGNAWIEQLEFADQGRAAIRCSTPDHLPLIGALPDIQAQAQQYAGFGGKHPRLLESVPINHPGIYLFTGLGSRGLTTAPLMADVLAAQMTAEPIPLPNRLLNALNPNRFLMKRLKRG